jgi:PST family polysaccharide transporter
MPNDYGVISLAYTVTALATVVQGATVREILIQRSAAFRRWQAPAFWLSALLGVAACTLILIAAPLAGKFYNSSEVMGVLAALAILPLLNALAVVPQARLNASLKFVPIFWIELAAVLTNSTLTIVCALAALGPYSFVVPQLVIACLSVVLYWKLSGLSLPLRQIRWRRWPLLYRDLTTLIASSGLLTIAGQVDRMILGHITTPADVGIYFFAYSFAIQTLQLFSGSVVSVMLPALVSVQTDLVRQRAIFERSTKLLGYVGMPLCLLQAALAEPLIQLLFSHKWDEAILIVQILCFGTAFDVVSATSHAAIRAQGRFNVVFQHSVLSLSIFIPAGILMALSYGTRGMALAFVLNFLICTPFLTSRVYGHWGGTLRDSLVLYLRPLFLCAASAIPGIAAYTCLLAAHQPKQLAIVLGATIGILTYVYLLQRQEPAVWQEVEQKAAAFRRKIGQLFGTTKITDRRCDNDQG